MTDSTKKKIIPEAVPMRRQEPKTRAGNFDEVALGYSPEEAMAEAQRCIMCKKKPCVPGCPVGIDIPSFINLVAQGDFLGAAHKIRETNLLPAICGRVCPQEDQCQQPCTIGKKHQGIEIGRLERFVADFEASEGDMEIPARGKPTGKKIAVIGSGPAGLTVASDLVRVGHEVTVFEALHREGGVLVYGIPEFRLPKAILGREVEFLGRMGVEFMPSAVIGKLFTVDELMESRGYGAVFIATGAGLPYFMDIPGINLNGVYSANEFLTRTNLMKAYLFPAYDTPVIRGRRVVVVGGGNTAMDSARCALRLGAEKVYLVYRRSRQEMPARAEEIENAEEEGIDFRLLTNPTRIMGDDRGFVTGVELQKQELGAPDSSGRRRPVPIEGSEYEEEVDVVVMAVGQGANPLIMQTTPDLETNRWGYIVADQKGATSKRGVFAGGDIVTGGATVISAMGAGREAAAAIDEFLS